MKNSSDISNSRCMQGITLIQAEKRTYRVSSSSIVSIDTINKENSDTKSSYSKNHNKSNENLVSNDSKLVKSIDPNIQQIHEKNVSNDQITTLKLKIPSKMYGHIIGRGGATLKQIESDTNTRIKIINAITGSNENIEKSKKRIYEIIRSVVPRSPPTHFLSLPLDTDRNLQQKISNFQSDVLSLSIPKIDPTILINPSSFHLTLGMLSLYIEEDIKGAVQLLKSLSTEVNDLVGSRIPVVKLSGLDIMDEDSTKTNVLYAKVEELGEKKILTKLAEFLNEKFSEAGYLKKTDRPLKLHATLINTSHRKIKGSYKNYERIPFSAVQILNKFPNIDFGTCRIENIHISKIGEHDENGRHKSEGKIKIK
ncbi:1122_t:CDS:2 [Entrophospora sp. SA101]|nr:15033_t:CDS:2 [Entrophospora sp. SA101]CAJ0842541.1 1122_t:CDS:2 [Entrophospora sp. SA101]